MGDDIAYSEYFAFGEGLSLPLRRIKQIASAWNREVKGLSGGRGNA
jgi:hypothetical protein